MNVNSHDGVAIIVEAGFVTLGPFVPTLAETRFRVVLVVQAAAHTLMGSSLAPTNDCSLGTTQC